MAPKKVVQDIVPSNRRSIRSIPIQKTREEEPEEVEQVEEEITDEPVKKKRAPRKREKPTKKISGVKTLITFVVILLCIGMIGVALSLLYTKAVVTVKTKSVPINIDGSFIAKKDVQSDITLSYQVVTAIDEASKTVSAIDGSLIQTKAKGTVIIYNNYSTTAQKIIAGTRLSNSNGLIYRTSATVTIPGKKSTGPGSITVGIIADQAGENYNAEMSDLTGDLKVVAYKGTDKYATIYGRLKTDITGGYSGHKKIISLEDQKTATTELQNDLKAKLLAKITSTVPQGFTMFDGAYNIEYGSVSTSTLSTTTANLTMKATLYAVIFNSKNLIEYIAKKQIQASQLITYRIDGLPALGFKIINVKDFSAKKGTSLSFSLKGPITVTGTIIEQELKKKLLGVKLKDSEQIIMQNTSISGSSVLLTPFWMRSFPNSPEKITILYK